MNPPVTLELYVSRSRWTACRSLPADARRYRYCDQWHGFRLVGSVEALLSDCRVPDVPIHYG